MAPPEPEPIEEAEVNAVSENVKPAPRLTYPNVYAAPAAFNVVSVPADKPKDAIMPPVIVIRTTAPEEVPWLVPSP